MKLPAIPSWEPYARSPANEIERINSALQSIDANDRETWLRMGMAVKAELGDEGRDMWITWSQQSPSFNPNTFGCVSLQVLFYTQPTPA